MHFRHFVCQLFKLFTRLWEINKKEKGASCPLTIQVYITWFYFNIMNFRRSEPNDSEKGGRKIREVFAPHLFLPLSLFCCQQANLRQSEFKFLQQCLVNSRWDKTVCKCRRAKIIQGENYPLYSNNFHYFSHI